MLKQWLDYCLGYDDYLDISGFDSKIVKLLYEAGFRSPDDLRRADDKTLKAIKGIGPAKVAKFENF